MSIEYQAQLGERPNDDPWLAEIYDLPKAPLMQTLAALSDALLTHLCAQIDGSDLNEVVYFLLRMRTWDHDAVALNSRRDTVYMNRLIHLIVTEHMRRNGTILVHELPNSLFDEAGPVRIEKTPAGELHHAELKRRFES